MPTELLLKAFDGFPLIKKGDNLGLLICEQARKNNWLWQDGDVLIIAQKVVSKSEGREVHLSSVTPSQRAINYGLSTEKDPRIIQLILDESSKVLRTRKGLIVVEHRLGFICANAGIDQSNISQDETVDPVVLLLPQNPDQSAMSIRTIIEKETGKKVGVLIIDSHGRAWRNGIVGVTIGLSGIEAVADRRGEPDLFGRILKVTEIGACDELAAAGSLLMGQGNEGKPVVFARGFPYEMSNQSSLRDLIRDSSEDLFR